MKTFPWTLEEEKITRAMLSEDANYYAIGTRLGRTYKSVHSKVVSMTRTPEDRARLADKRRQMQEPIQSYGYNSDHRDSMVPAEVMDARNRRLNADPRDLTGAFFGDPKVGYSALDHRAGA